jgi:glycosyltransferase involved in cell wall biosynthesis
MIGERLGASDPSNQRYLAEIEALAAELVLEPPILQWTGTLSGEEVVEGLRAADVMVLPYRDGASLRRGTLCAALACGRPTVTTTPHTPVPILQDGKNILFAPPGNPVAVAAQVARLLDDEPFRQRMAQAAGALAPHFDWETIAVHHITIYQEILGTP